MVIRVFAVLTALSVYLGMSCLGEKNADGQSSFIDTIKKRYTRFFSGEGAPAPAKKQKPPEQVTRLASLSADQVDVRGEYVRSQLARRVGQPKIYRGLYLHNVTGRDYEKLKEVITTGLNYGINTLVVDIQRRPIPAENMALMKEARMYPVARLVCFEGGLKQVRPSKAYMENLYQLAEDAAKLGFEEIQLDYIRYADSWGRKKMKTSQKYEIIGNILAEFKERMKPYHVKVGADIFGRIPFNTGDVIGQKIELFAKEMDVLYPMLYPSHFYGDKLRIARPYDTIYEGVDRSIKRIEQDPAYRGTKVVAYIQAFRIKVGPSKLSYTDYIYRQLVAGERAGHGWVAWNARNAYEPTWKALEKLKKKGYTGVPKDKIEWKGFRKRSSI